MMLRPRQQLRPPPVANSLPEQEAWRAFLDNLATELSQLRAAASHESQLLDLSADPWTPPANLGDMPVEFEAQAKKLLNDIAQLQPVLAQQRDATAKQLRLVDAVPRDGAETAIYLDSAG